MDMNALNLVLNLAIFEKIVKSPKTKTSPKFPTLLYVMICHVCCPLAQSLQVSKGKLIELEKEMTVDKLAKKMNISPSKSVQLCILG